jgi:hypothetical protein
MILMAELKVGFSQSPIDPDECIRRLARVYEYILSLPDRLQEDAEIANKENNEGNVIENDEADDKLFDHNEESN